MNSFPIQPQDKQVSNIETEKKSRSLLLNSPEITESFAERLMKFLACFIWLGGFIISIVISRIPGHYSWETEFSWKTFWISILIFFLSGSFTWCMAELFGNLNSIAGILKEFRLDQYDDSDK